MNTKISDPCPGCSVAVQQHAGAGGRSGRDHDRGSQYHGGTTVAPIPPLARVPASTATGRARTAGTPPTAATGARPRRRPTGYAAPRYRPGHRPYDRDGVTIIFRGRLN